MALRDPLRAGLAACRSLARCSGAIREVWEKFDRTVQSDEVALGAIGNGRWRKQKHSHSSLTAMVRAEKSHVEACGRVGPIPPDTVAAI